MEGFASYSQQLRKVENERDKERETMQFVLSLLNSLLVSGVLVSKTDRNNVEEMEIAWEMCGECVKEVSEFIEVQTPLKAQGLQENMKVSFDKEYQQIIITLYPVSCYRHVKRNWSGLSHKPINHLTQILKLALAIYCRNWTRYIMYISFTGFHTFL